MGEYADTWANYKKLVDQHNEADTVERAKIAPQIEKVVKKLESVTPKDDADNDAKKEHDNWDASGAAPKQVVGVPPKTGDVLKKIDTAIKGSNPPPKAGSSGGGSSGI